MRSLLFACAVLLVACTACAAGQVPDATLSSFGLSGMQQMTDAQGTQIRGMGFAAVGGFSFASAPGSATGNGYVGVSATSNALTAGGSISVAASGAGFFPPHGNASGFVVGSVAFGGAVAYAK